MPAGHLRLDAGGAPARRHPVPSLYSIEEEVDLIDKIMERGYELANRFDLVHLTDVFSWSQVRMDIVSCHHFVPMFLRDWLSAADSDFSHDFFGIYKHWDRRELALTDGFNPRFAEKQ